MTQSQRFHLCVDLWKKVCAKKGWHQTKDGFRRRELYAEAFQDAQYLADISPRTPPTQFSDFQERDFDEAKRHFLAIIFDSDVNKQMRQLQQPDTRLHVKIQMMQMPCVAVCLRLIKEKKDGAETQDFSFYQDCKAGRMPLRLMDHEAAERWVTELLEDRFKTNDIRAISNQPQPRYARKRNGEVLMRNGEPIVNSWKSDLELLRDTLDARINALRNEAGLTIHEMKTFAEVECTCAPCEKRKALNHQAAKVLAHDHNEEVAA